MSKRAWKRLLFWLDISGLALPLLICLEEHDHLDTLPNPVRQRLQQDLRDNSERMEAMAVECERLLLAFHLAEMQYVLVKGFSLVPHSVERIASRSQLDIDLLIAPADIPAAQSLLEASGYKLHGQFKGTWEYKDDPRPKRSIKDLYKNYGGRSVELHSAVTHSQLELLKRRTLIPFRSAVMPTLAHADAFLGQMLHAFKHILGEGGRSMHLLEIYHHIVYRRDQNDFWEAVRASAADRYAEFAIAFVTTLLERTFGELPSVLTSWTSGRLPRFAELWIDRYGAACVVGKFPGTKLSTLLREELIAQGVLGPEAKIKRRIPIRLPPRIEKPAPGETLKKKTGRYWRQAAFIISRLRFHIVEDLRLRLERKQWLRVLDGNDLELSMGVKTQPSLMTLGAAGTRRINSNSSG